MNSNKIAFSFDHNFHYSGRIISKLHPKKISKLTSILICMLFWLFPMCLCSICPASISDSYATTSNEDSISGYTYTETFNSISGPISSSMYYLYKIYLSPNFKSVIRKVNFKGSLEWMTALSVNPIVKSLSIDSNEQNVYIGSTFTTALNVIRMDSSTGGIVDAQYFSFLNGQTFDIKIHLLSDNSGYYTSGKDGTNRPNICKYLFLSPTTSQCQKIGDFHSYSYGQLKLSDSSLFMLGYHPNSPFQLHMYKMIFGSTSPDWALMLACSSGSCFVNLAESLLLSPSIYSFFAFGSTQYLYLFYKQFRVKHNNRRFG